MSHPPRRATHPLAEDRTWTVLPDPNTAAHTLAAEVERLRGEVERLRGEVERLRGENEGLDEARRDDQCCDDACPGGACESCRCCAAGWCVTGTDGLPEDDDDLLQWIELAAPYNPIVEAWRLDRAEVVRLRAENDRLDTEMDRLLERAAEVPILEEQLDEAVGAVRDLVNNYAALDGQAFEAAHERAVCVVDENGGW